MPSTVKGEMVVIFAIYKQTFVTTGVLVDRVFSRNPTPTANSYRIQCTAPGVGTDTGVIFTREV